MKSLFPLNKNQPRHKWSLYLKSVIKFYLKLLALFYVITLVKDQYSNLILLREFLKRKKKTQTLLIIFKAGQMFLKSAVTN